MRRNRNSYDNIDKICAELKKTSEMKQASIHLGYSGSYIHSVITRLTRKVKKESDKRVNGRKYDLAEFIRAANVLSRIRDAIEEGKTRQNALLKNSIEELYGKGYGLGQMVKLLHVHSSRIKRIAPEIDFHKDRELRLRLRKRRELIDKERIVAEYRTGLFTGTALAKRHGIAVSTALYIIKDAGLKVVTPLGNGDPEQLRLFAEIQHLKDLGWSVSEIAKFKGMNSETVRRRLSRLAEVRDRINGSRDEAEINNVKMAERYLNIFKMLSEGVSQVSVARATGYTRQHINHIVKGRFNPASVQ